jgi:hypothetical protein
MSFLDKLGPAAAAAKWKADQQMRVMRVQSSIHELENQVKTQKASLADSVMDLYQQGQLADASLQNLCAAIAQNNTQIGALTDNLHQIQAEQAPTEAQPAQAAATAPVTPAPAPIPNVVNAPAASAIPAPEAPVVLVCPECGQVLKGKFCPEHGREGIPQV